MASHQSMAQPYAKNVQLVNTVLLQLRCHNQLMTVITQMRGLQRKLLAQMVRSAKKTEPMRLVLKASGAMTTMETGTRDRSNV